MKRKLLYFVAFCVIIGSCLSTVSAEGSTGVWGSVQDETAVLYLAGASGTLSCQVGNVPMEIGAQGAITEQDVPLETVIVLDNSISIAQEHRTIVKDVLDDLVANRLNGETYTLVTISDEVTYLCEKESDYTKLKSLINGLEYRDQNTQLTDGLYKVLDKLRQADTGVLQRIILIADGVDNKQVGYTKEELEKLIAATGYPVYTIGCTNVYGGTAEETQNLFSLSRVSSGTSFDLTQTQDSMAIVNQICEWNNAVRVEIPLTAEVSDGSSKMVRVTSDSGQEYTMQLTMPFGQREAETEDTTPVTVPEPVIITEENDNEQILLIILIGIGVLLVVGIIVAVILFVVHKRKKEREFVHNQNSGRPDEAETVYANSDALEETAMADATGIAFDPEPGKLLILRDVNNSSRRFEVTLQEGHRVQVGRDRNQCRIALPGEATVSRRQCDIYMTNNVVYVENLSEKNVTRVDSARVTGEMELKNGSTLNMGDVTMNVEIKEI